MLLLQGPAGPFFLTLARALTTRPGCNVHKVNLNGGDEAFFPPQSRAGGLRVTPYAGRLDGWFHWLDEFIAQRRVDAVVLFGQCRAYHAVAVEVARRRGVAVYVFEEGYLRPNFVTLERGGVNAYSALPRDPDAYRIRLRAHGDQTTGSEPFGESQLPAPTVGGVDRATKVALPVPGNYRRMAAYQIRYLAAIRLAAKRFPHYRHHRDARLTVEAARWSLAGMRKLACRVTERALRSRLESRDMHGRFFLVPLQVCNDSQVVHHSRFESVGQFVDEVLESFAAHAPAEAHLVIKHHPMDRAYSNYRAQIARRARGLGVADRVHYLDDAHLPTLLKSAVGVVTINSTVGLSALLHSTPCVALGEAFYAMPGLARSGGLDDFWRDPGTVDASLFAAFRSYLLQQTQLEGSFYGEVPAVTRLAQRVLWGLVSHSNSAVRGAEDQRMGTEREPERALAAVDRTAPTPSEPSLGRLTF